MFLELLAAAFLAGGDSDNRHSGYDPHPRKKSIFDDDEFEEDDSFFDHNGDEHIIDEDRYCEDCDDYHDDF